MNWKPLNITKPLKTTLCVLLLGVLSYAPPLLSQSSGLLATGARVTLVRAGFGFLEGPVADESGNLFFTDIDNNRVQRLSLSGELTTVYEPSNNANGLTMDLNGNLLICEQSGQRLTSMDARGNITVVADRYDGNQFNSPNDVWVHPGGGIYFTDPRYRFPEGDPPQDGEHVYYVSPNRSSVTRVVEDMAKPNGVVGTEDGQTLYVADTQLRKVFQFDVAADGSLTNRREFADQGSDGMTLDERGNVYLTWGGGVGIFNPDGDRIEFIDVPENPANVGFAGADGRTLYMTARTGLYSIRMNVGASR